MKFLKLLRLDFLPRNVDFGLLVMRIWFGGAMAILHGWAKLTGFNDYSTKFMKFLGLSSTVSLSMAIFGEFVCCILLVLGLFTRFAALSAAITMAVAFFMAHEGNLSGPKSGEMAFVYLAAFVVLFITGHGKFSVDARRGGKV